MQLPTQEEEPETRLQPARWTHENWVGGDKGWKQGQGILCLLYSLGREAALNQ